MKNPLHSGFFIAARKLRERHPRTFRHKGETVTDPESKGENAAERRRASEAGFTAFIVADFAPVTCDFI